MTRIVCGVLFAGALMATAGFSVAQPPPGGKGDKGPKGGPKGGGSTTPDVVTVMMGFDKNKDGQVTREEVTDTRLLRLFDRADAGKKGVVTRDQFTKLAADLAAEEQTFGGGKGDKGGKGPPKGEKGGPPPGDKGGPPPKKD